MDIERSVEFILEQQAKIVAQQQQADRRINAVVKLVQTGMRMLVKLEEGQTELRKSVAELVKAQKETDYKLNALIESQTALMEAQKKNEERFAKNEEKFAKNDERFAKNDERFARSDARFERLMAALLRKRTNGGGGR